MRTRLLPLALIGFLACSSDDHPAKYDLTGSPSTALDAGDPRELPTRPDGSAPGNAVGTGVTSGTSTSRLDASVLDAQIGEASVSDGGAVPFGYQCTADIQCALRNVGSCCGFNPRCTNVNAIFTNPDCSGGNTGTCSFPPIDSCACQNGQCVSLQAGMPVNFPP